MTIETATPSMDDGATFKNRVGVFWDWFATQANRFRETIDKGNGADLGEEVSQAIATILPGMSWAFGPGEQSGHSFTLTGEGLIVKQLLAAYWINESPTINGWTFHASRQPSTPSELGDMAIGIGDGKSVTASEFLVATTPDETEEKFDIVGWHPLMENVSEEHHMTILFLLLDEALGEFGTEQWLGSVKVQPIEPDAKTVPLVGLPEFLSQAQRYHQWEKLDPLQTYYSYQPDDQTESPRGDTIVGTTMIPQMVIDYINEDGQLTDDPLADTGAELAYVRFLSENLPEGDEAHVRGNIEDAIDDALRDQQAGRTVGGAVGATHSYIDLLLIDGQNSRDIVGRTIATLNLRGGATLESMSASAP